MTATYLGVYLPGTPEWLELRKDKVGGSDLAAILGLSPWQSAYSLWYQKRGDVDLTEDKPQLEWGTRLEPVIVQAWADRHPEFTVNYVPGATYAHPEHPWITVAPDALVYANESAEHFDMPLTGVEAKTSRYDYSWHDGVPDYYSVQAQWAMLTFAVPAWHFAVLFGGSDFQTFTVDAHPAVQEALIDAASQFLDDLATGRVPPLDGHDTTYTTVRALHPEIDADEAVEVGELGSAWIAALKAQRDADEAAKEARARVADLMGRAKVATLDGAKIAYRQPGQKGAPPFLKAVNGLLSRAS